jgi:sugar diacid utilization regulator
MQKKNLIPEGNARQYLEIAALHPQRRGEMLGYALQELLGSLPAVGTALIWPCQDRKVPWKIHYAGMYQESIQPWLRARLHTSLDATFGVLQQDLRKLSDMPFPELIYLQPAPIFSAGIWLIWPLSPSRPEPASKYQEEIRLMLEALLEVEGLEGRYFPSTSPLSDKALIDALAQGDPYALSALLGLTRLIGNAELTAWGRAYQDVVETTDHMGAKQSGFGFVLPHGKGAGGYIAAHGTPIITVEDYRNSPFRHPSVSDIVDSEQVRSMIALPVRSRTEKGEHVVGILYATRRTVKPFSLAESLLVRRMTTLLEPLPPLTRSPSFLSPGLPSVSDQKAAWYKLILHANRMESLETWISQFIKGTVIVTDSDGRPYVFAHTQELERMRATLDNSRDGIQVIPLSAPGVSSPGQVYLRSAVPLPPPEWPEFFADLVVACDLIIGRMEQARDHLARQREQWLQALLQGKPLPEIRQDGYRLGLPVRDGQLWVIAWPFQKLLTRQAVRQRMLVENIVLDQLESPLLFLGDDLGVILLDEDAKQKPARLRDLLITQFAPYPLWIIYGANYHSLGDLKMLLTHSISQAQKARREGRSEYLLDVQTPGLESLLANPRLGEDLRSFAIRLLTPLLEYDRNKGTDLTKTFVLAQVRGSAQAVAEELEVHVNTIRYRIHKAEEILGSEDASPKDRIAWGFASFIWQEANQLEHV